ncbi:phosphatase and actin regulator 2 [Trichonephila clavipes]|nr:phosphatase and actin regulator 2 [Trichonephila clavipes]
MRSTKEELIKKGVLMPDGTDKYQDSKINVSLLNLPDVEEVPSHDGEIVLSVLPEPPISLNDIGPILHPQQ